ncbi:DUF3800 domain-containing protein [Staphylococcus ureilyticus]|uniref:DUF3800 domain-containing protein n=1 Tax=Staphylococcus ureilyticus TaxID=94138 RepID=UPI0021CEC7BA|nr:DUF3800 domain-containing protein [Staphylococcus ureilyticus]UXS59923.1 DUF3800 domain-containing protein [Staphylococcus ureilyticus]
MDYIQNIEVFCDESSLENLFSTNKSGFMVLGGIWLNKEDHKTVKKDLDSLKKRYDIGGEFKWNKVSNSKENFYFDVLDYFFGNRKIRFRCIVVETSKVNTQKYHNSDNELGFYKFYFNLLDKWCMNYASYSIYLDYKSNKDAGRLPKLKEILNNITEGEIKDVLPIRSEESVFIQLADLLSGSVAYHYNNKRQFNNTKSSFVTRLEEHLGGEISSSPRQEKKFNVFKIRLDHNV